MIHVVTNESIVNECVYKSKYYYNTYNDNVF